MLVFLISLRTKKQRCRIFASTCSIERIEGSFIRKLESHRNIPTHKHKYLETSITIERQHPAFQTNQMENNNGLGYARDFGDASANTWQGFFVRIGSSADAAALHTTPHIPQRSAEGKA
jgi:hypothetical protein